MASTDTTICNLALGKLGAGSIISIEENSPEGRACRLHYQQTRDEVLRSHRWNFAIKRVELSRLSDAPAFGWSYQYQLPVECLRILQVNGYQEWEDPDCWEVEGGKLLTDEETVQAKYIASVTDANLYDPLFIEALSLKLASKICVPLTGSDNRAGGFLTEYERVVGPLARKTDAFESREKRKSPWVLSDFVKSRFQRIAR